MEVVLCEIDESPAAKEAARKAIAHCRERGAQLELVGVVRWGLGDDGPTPTYAGRLVSRRAEVERALRWASEAARQAGLTPKVVIRAGEPEEEIRREAEVAGAEVAFLGHTHRLSALTRRPRVEVEELRLRKAA